MGPELGPASWLEGAPFLKIPRQAKVSALSRIPLGQAPAHPNRDHDKYQAVAADGAGITAFRGILSLQPAPLLNFVVMPLGFLRVHNVSNAVRRLA